MKQALRTSLALQVLALPENWLLAEQGRYVHMGERFSNSSRGLPLIQVAGLVLVLALVVVGVWLLSRYLDQRDGDGYRSRWRMFWEMCRAHGLRFRHS